MRMTDDGRGADVTRGAHAGAGAGAETTADAEEDHQRAQGQTLMSDYMQGGKFAKQPTRNSFSALATVTEASAEEESDYGECETCFAPYHAGECTADPTCNHPKCPMNGFGHTRASCPTPFSVHEMFVQ